MMDNESAVFVCRCAEWAALQGLFVEWVEAYAVQRALGKDPFFSAALALIRMYDAN